MKATVPKAQSTPPANPPRKMSFNRSMPIGGMVDKK